MYKKSYEYVGHKVVTKVTSARVKYDTNMANKHENGV